MRTVTAALLLSLTGLASAQVFLDDYAFVYHHLHWREVDAATNQPVANPNGIIVPGEAAHVWLTASFWPPVGTAVPQPPAVEPG